MAPQPSQVRSGIAIAPDWLVTGVERMRRCGDDLTAGTVVVAAAPMREIAYRKTICLPPRRPAQRLERHCIRKPTASRPAFAELRKDELFT